MKKFLFFLLLPITIIGQNNPCLNTSSITAITSCDSFDWNGTTYNSTGTYNYSGISVANTYSMSFDGIDDYVNLGSVLNEPSENGIIFISFKLSNDFNSDNMVRQSLLDKYNNLNDAPIDLRLDENEGKLCFRIQPEGFAPGGWEYVYSINSQWNANQWYNIAVSWGADGMKMYIDGALEGTNPSTIKPGLCYNDLLLGADYNWNGAALISDLNNYFDGEVDNLQIWSALLNQQEIQNYMNCPPAGNEAGLVGSWNFEEGSGNTVLDISGNGNNGTINGATYDSNVPSQSCTLTNSNGLSTCSRTSKQTTKSA